MDQTKDIGSEIMMVQLLFKSKPNSPTTEQFRKALEKRFGVLGEIPYVEPSKKSSGDMFMVPIPKYKAVFKDKPEGVPVIAAFLSAAVESGINIDDMARQQMWDVPNASEIIDECRHTIIVNTTLGRALSARNSRYTLGNWLWRSLLGTASLSARLDHRIHPS